jgi:hypothetical protein
MSKPLDDILHEKATKQNEKPQDYSPFPKTQSFLNCWLTLLGFFLLLPNALTLLYLAAGYLLIQIQIRLEEEFLEKQHDIHYYNYKKAYGGCSKTSLWMTGCEILPVIPSGFWNHKLVKGGHLTLRIKEP